MVGLRERQKADRKSRILQAAIALFRSQRYEAVRIEALAAAADISVGTVYNYFESKGDILIALVAMEVEEVLQAGRVLVADPPEGADTALEALIFTYYDHALYYLTKEMWRAAMALAIAAPTTPYGRRYAALDTALGAQVTDLLRALQDRGEVDPALELSPLGEVIFNNLNEMFVLYVKDEAMSLDCLKARVAAQMRPLARLMAAGR